VADLVCPCEDGLPDPCTLCGEPADGICRLDLVQSDAYRRGVEAERQRILGRLDACDDDYDEFLRLIVAQKPALGGGAIGTAAAALAELRHIVSPPQEGTAG